MVLWPFLFILVATNIDDIQTFGHTMGTLSAIVHQFKRLAEVQPAFANPSNKIRQPLRPV